MTSPFEKNDPTRAQALKEAKEELACMIGMAELRNWIGQINRYIATQAERSRHGLTPHRSTLHMALTGPPGTGKTTVARIMAKLLYGYGLLSTDKFFEVGREQLVGRWVGASDVITKQILAEASGGVLFIDEAYALANDSERDFGKDVINQIVRYIENNRDDFVLILAGYDQEMDNFLAANRGLRGRIRLRFSLRDYSPHDLCRIFDRMAWDADYILSPEAQARAALLIHVAWAKRKADFDNGRFVRNVFDRVAELQGDRIGGKADRDALRTIVEEDVPTAEFSSDFDVGSIDISNLTWRITTGCCKKPASFQIQALRAENSCACGKPLVLPWGSIDFASAGPGFEQIMQRVGAKFSPAEAEVLKPRPKRHPSKFKRPADPPPANPIPDDIPNEPSSPTTFTPPKQHADASSTAAESWGPIPWSAIGDSFFAAAGVALLVLMVLALGVLPAPVGDTSVGRYCLALAVLNSACVILWVLVWNLLSSRNRPESSIDLDTA